MTKSNVKKLMGGSDAKKQLADMQKIIDRQASQIERYRGVKLPRVKPRKPRRSKKGFIRVICGDSHGASQNDAAVAAFLGDLELLAPSEIIHVGDALDCGGFLTQHGTLGVVQDLMITYEQDVIAANRLLDGMHKASPHAKITLIEGNHEKRIKTWVCKQVLFNTQNAEYLLRLFGVPSVLNIEKRGIRFIERDQYYDGISISGTIALEPHAIAQHGEGASGGKFAVFRQLDRLKRSVFFGHTHRLGSVYCESVDAHLVSVNTGCLCNIRPLYMMNRVTDWTHGYVIVFVEPDERDFLAVTVPIVDGKSYLSPLMRAIG